MVIDDEFDIVRVVQRYLEKWGFEVDTFTNPLYALDVFRKNPDRYSVVLTDINMPEMRGTVLAKLMQAARPDVKVIIMTAYEVAPEDLSMNLPTITHDQILKKPFTLLAVCDAIKKQLATVN
jgi:DNA-binding NtrC family response regulator